MRNSVFSIILVALMLWCFTACSSNYTEGMKDLSQFGIGVAATFGEKANSGNGADGVNKTASVLADYSDTAYTTGHAVQSVTENIGIKNAKGLKLFTYYSTGVAI